MHPYSTEESRVSTYAALAVASVVISWGIVAATSKVSWPQWLISPPSLAATFGLLYRLFDRFLWRLPLFHKFGVVGVEDISGAYNGTLISTFKDSGENPAEKNITLRVSQTWTRISIEMTVSSGSSSSVSTSAIGSVTADGHATLLTYIYRNSVNPGLADSDMGDHDGAAELRIYEDGRATGRYFNSRPAAGTIVARREE